MKRLQLKIAIVAMLFGVFSCDKVLDLKPHQSIGEDVVLTNDANVKSVMVGAYNKFRHWSIYGGCILRNSELLGGTGEIQWEGTYNAPREIFNHAIISSNGDVTAQWMNSYNVINITNNVLSAITVVNSADRGRIEGEALFMRSLMYFDLVRFFAKQYDPTTTNTQYGVPIVLTPTRGVSVTNNIGRSSVDQVYTQVITDLKRAAYVLPRTNGIYAAKGTAWALLARVYLQMSDFANAGYYADSVIRYQSGSAKVYGLNTSYAAAFNNLDNTKEDIFATKFIEQDGINQMTEFWSTTEYGGRDGDISILDAHLNLYNASDERLAMFWEGNDAWRSGKWNTQYGIVNLFRLAEMFLIRAECNIRLSTAVGDTPLNDYNAIHTRAGLTAAGSVTLADILLERRLELAHEGFKIHDVRRLHLNVGSLTYNDPSLLFPIPEREIQANPAIKDQQNDGY